MKDAKLFLKENNIRFSYELVDEINDGSKFPYHFLYKVKLYNRDNKKSMQFDFTDSYQNWHDNIQTLDEYDVLACLEKYDTGSLEEFCSTYGYTFTGFEELRKVQGIYNACKRQVKAVHRVFENCFEELCEFN